MKNRRILLGAFAAGFLAPRFAFGQRKTANVVVLSAGDSEDDEPATRSFYDEMRRRGWSEGVNIAYNRLYGKGSRTYVEGLASSAAGSAADLVFTNFEAIAKILARYRRAGIHAVMTTPSFTLLARRRELVALGERNGLALVGHRVEFAEAGALLSYGPEIVEAQRRSAAIADRILKGARPAEIPVERAGKAELVVNRRVAHALGIHLSKSLQQRADRLID